MGKNKKDALMKDIDKNAAWICEVMPNFCKTINHPRATANSGSLEKTNTTNVNPFLNNFFQKDAIGGNCGTSLKNLVHMGQLLHSGKFQKYDYGAVQNLNIYGTVEPEQIDLSKIEVPVGMLVGLSDDLALLKNNLVVKSKLKNVADFVTLPGIDHQGMIFGHSMNHGKYLVSILNKYRL